LRGSGTIENDSDTVVFVWRKRDENEQLTAEASIIIAKVRMGKLGYIRAHFDGDVQTFTPVLAEGRVAGTADEFGDIEDF
jgi:replicative DNA helicase